MYMLETMSNLPQAIMRLTDFSLHNIAWNSHIIENAGANLQLCVWWIMAIRLVKLVLHSHGIFKFSQPVTTLHFLAWCERHHFA
jgi:hypothetical protein